MEEQVIRALFDKKLVCYSIDSKPGHYVPAAIVVTTKTAVCHKAMMPKYARNRKYAQEHLHHCTRKIHRTQKSDESKCNLPDKRHYALPPYWFDGHYAWKEGI